MNKLRAAITTTLAVLFAVPPQRGGYDATRYPRTWNGAWRYWREQILPTYLPVGHWLDQEVTPAAVLRRAAHWRTVSWISAVIMLVGLVLDARLIPALAAGVLLLAIGERSECLGWISGYVHHSRQSHPNTGGTW